MPMALPLRQMPAPAAAPKKPAPPRWQIRPVDDAVCRNLTQALELPPLVARLLACRSITQPDAAEHYLRPVLAQLHDPFLMKGMEPAAERIVHAIRNGEPICIYGDYDVDGISATAILMTILRELGAEVTYYIPDRFSEGYGVNNEALEQIAGEGARVVITVDCGIRAVDQAELARRRGIDLIITDHHEPGPRIPPAFAVINPRQPGCAYPDKGLAGSGVAFKLAHAVLRKAHPDGAAARELLKSTLDFVALGTVADVVPLLGENRAMVSFGLKLLRETRRPGLLHLFQHAAIDPRKLQTHTIGFGIGPRLNAAGRTDHAMFGLELLLSRDARAADGLAAKLEQFNANRRAIEMDILREAVELIEPRAHERVLVVAREEWHHGVLGIVASRIVQRYYRPTIVIGITDGVGKGSGRSIEGFDLHAALESCGGHLLQFGGHMMAAGLSVAADAVEAFRAAINAHAEQVLPDDLLRPLLWIDAAARTEDLTEEFVNQLELFEPFGQDNPRPVIALDEVALIEPPRVLKDRHLKLMVAGRDGRPLCAMGWGMADRLHELNADGTVLRLAGAPCLNRWNGRVSVEMELRDFQVVG